MALKEQVTDLPGQDFLRGGGEMGALTREYDWTKTPLGPPAAWPQSLKTAVRILLTSQHPMFIWWGPDLIQFYNDAYRQTMGAERHSSALGQRGRDCWEEIWDIIGPQIEFVMQGKGATWHVDQLVPVTRHGRREDVWWTYGYSPIEEADTVGGVLVVCNDVTEQHLLTERLRLANRELHHRVRNTLATVQAILGSTARTSLNITDFHEAFAGRLVALGNSHSILTDSERQEANVSELLRLELEPYDDATGQRMRLEGPKVPLPARLAVVVALAFHELVTNAAKYGALSDLAGVLTVTWRVVEDGNERMLHIEWMENDGPPVVAPTREGFGSHLLNKVLPVQVDGTIKMDFAPTGLRVSISVPLIDIGSGLAFS
jgi:two-component sensor histidine kinase